MSGRPVRVLLADDDEGVRTALADLVGADPQLELVGAAQDAQEAIRLAAEVTPDVAVLDVKMPGGGGPAAAQGIRRVSPGTTIVALSAWDDPASADEMRRAGAAAYVVKGAPAADLLATIRRYGSAYARRRLGTV